MEKITNAEFDKVFRLMEMSFPPEERRIYEEQKALFFEKHYRVYGIRGDDSDSVIAFMAVWEWEDLLFIEHFAVDPSFRNRGLGKHMLCEIVSISDKPVCLEVELPDNEIAKRRIAFYERCGFVLNEYPYIQPSMAKGCPPVPLKIMTYGRAITDSEFEKMKDTLYTYVYNSK